MSVNLLERILILMLNSLDGNECWYERAQVIRDSIILREAIIQTIVKERWKGARSRRRLEQNRCEGGGRMYRRLE